MIPVPPCYYIMPLHLAGAFFCSLPRKIFLPREEKIFSSRGKLFLLFRKGFLNVSDKTKKL